MKNKTKSSTAASPARSSKRDGRATTAAGESEHAEVAKDLKDRALARWENEGGSSHGRDAVTAGAAAMLTIDEVT